jgi:hypothetical protein
VLNTEPGYQDAIEVGADFTSSGPAVTHPLCGGEHCVPPLRVRNPTTSGPTQQQSQSGPGTETIWRQAALQVGLTLYELISSRVLVTRR